MTTYTKDPNAVLDYQWQWTSWLNGDTISSATVTAETGVTVDSSSTTTATVTAFLSGGTVGERYTVTCRIVTAGGRTEDRSIQIVVSER